jgi:serine/threonine protein kinase
MLVTRGRRADQVKLVDFGLAKLLAETRRETRWRARPNTSRPNVSWADLRPPGRHLRAGVLAYEILTGRVPFRATSYLGTLTKHVEEPPPPLRCESGHIPEPLAAVVLQMLEKESPARPSNMGIVEAMLCEAQIAAGLRTSGDDLELPAVDEIWRKKLAARMPAPWGRRRRPCWAGRWRWRCRARRRRCISGPCGSRGWRSATSR